MQAIERFWGTPLSLPENELRPSRPKDPVVQSNSSEKRPQTQSQPGVADNVRLKPRAAAPEAPNELDLAASPATEGPSQRNLLDVCLDLFGKLEGTMVTNRREFVDAYFTTLVKQDEMTTLWTEPAYYEHLRSVVHKDVLPLYDRYCAMRDEALKQIGQRSWPRYCLWSIGICLAFELLFTEGRVLRPQALLPAVVVDGLLGYGVYYLANFRQTAALKRARKNLLNSIREIESQHEVAKRYDIFRTYTGGDLLTGELQVLLASYASPGEFWNDYYAVRSADPTTAAGLEKLGIKRFNDFLELHANGSYSQEARQQRFNALFLLAHKAFIMNDREHYVLNHLKTNTKR
jgi:hypothetical protein